MVLKDSFARSQAPAWERADESLIVQVEIFQMPLFTKQEHELDTHFDKWVYFLKHLEDFDHIPAILNEPIFQRGFDIAEVSNLSSDQYDAYVKSVLSYNEAKAVTDTAIYDGKIEGETAKAIEIAKNLLTKGFDVATVADITRLTTKEIEGL